MKRLSEWFSELTSRILGQSRLPPRALRAGRVQLLPLHSIKFHPTAPAFADKLPLVNLSASGVAFHRQGSNQWPELGTVVEGMFQLEGQEFPARIRLVRVSDTMVGGQFEGGLHQMHRMVLRYFEVELAALAMIEVRPDILERLPEGSLRLFRGQDNCELSLVVDGRPGAEPVVKKFFLSFFGNQLEGGAGLALRYGHVVNEMSSRKASARPLQEIHFHGAVPDEILQVARKFLGNISQLDKPTRESLLSYLGNSGS